MESRKQETKAGADLLSCPCRRYEVVLRKIALMWQFFTKQFVFERKQIVLIRHEKLFEISRAVLRDKSLRNEDYYAAGEF